MIHPKIFHHGFKQPHELTPFLEDAACFVMPSKKEPWGVVLHEMAIAGLPLLASKNVGSATAFLDCTLNGFSSDISRLIEVLRDFVLLTFEARLEMGHQSQLLSGQITQEKWMANLLKLIKR